MTSKLLKTFFQVRWIILVFSNNIDGKIYEFPTPEAVIQGGSVKKGVLENFTKFTGKHQSPFFNEVAGFIINIVIVMLINLFNAGKLHNHEIIYHEESLNKMTAQTNS